MGPTPAEEEESEARTRADVQCSLERHPGLKGEACAITHALGRGIGDADALRRAAREFYLHAVEEKQRQRERQLGICAVFAVVGFVCWWVWCAYR